MKELLKDYSLVIESPIAWGEMDAFQHVNNIIYFRYFESARIAYFTEAGIIEFMSAQKLGPILASTSCQYKFPLSYPDQLSIGARTTQIEEDQFSMEYIVVSHQHKRIAAKGEGRIVYYDYAKSQKTAIPEPIRQKILQMDNLSS
jgi:acyl-CoA thioester hydrolase